MESVVKSADRVVTVLSVLAEVPTGLTFTDLLARLELPRSSLHALLQTLLQSRMIVYDGETKLYHYGPKVWELSMSYYHRIHLVPLAWPYLQEIRDRTNQTVQMAILDGSDILYVAKIESSHPLQLVSHVGSRLPAYATGLGKALLATLGPSALDRVLKGVTFQRFTSNTVGSHDELVHELALTRERGYAVDHGEYSADVRCVAYPVLGFQNLGIASISVSCSVEQFVPDTVTELTELLRKAAYEISIRAGSGHPEAWRQEATDADRVPVRATLL
ncbi:MAG: IclR family transcriptional regulator [Firmicutes bacterium]|nr:IclR family transcriptional regulator [Bacillota bacterium]